MRIALVINSASGPGLNQPTGAEIRQKITAAGLDAIPEPDPGLPLPARIAAAAALPGIGALAVAGGDGTISCAANRIAGQDLPLAVLPLGTMNLLAKDLGIPPGLDAAITNVAAGQARRIDLGDVNGHLFLTASFLGMPARIARHREAQRRRVTFTGCLRFAAGFLRHLGRYPKLRVKGHVAGAERDWRCRLIAVVNNDFAEQPGQFLVRDSVDGGTLTLYLLEKMSLWMMLRLAAGFAIGDWRHLPGVERHQVTSLEITSSRRALLVMNDGEVQLLDVPLKYGIRPKSLGVIVPATVSDSP